MLNSAVMPMPPCSWIASWPTCRPARLTCRPARDAASLTSAGEPDASTIDAHTATLRASSSDTYMSAARNVSAWKVFSVTPNCLRLLRYSDVVDSATSIAPTASLHAAMRAASNAEAMAPVESAPGVPRGRAGVESNVRRAARPPSWVAYPDLDNPGASAETRKSPVPDPPEPVEG